MEGASCANLNVCCSYDIHGWLAQRVFRVLRVGLVIIGQSLELLRLNLDFRFDRTASSLQNVTIWLLLTLLQVTVMLTISLFTCLVLS